MLLKVSERVLLLAVIPKEGNYTNLKILDELRMNLSYSEEELEKWDIDVNQKDRTVSWNEDGEADIPIGERATGIIVDEFRKLDKESKLSDQIVPLYEKFIPVTE